MVEYNRQNYTAEPIFSRMDKEKDFYFMILTFWVTDTTIST